MSVPGDRAGLDMERTFIIPSGLGDCDTGGSAPVACVACRRCEIYALGHNGTRGS